MRELRRLIQEDILNDHALHRHQRCRDMLRVRIGLNQILTVDVDAHEFMRQGRLEHVRDAKPGFLAQRCAPGVLEHFAHRGVGDVPIAGEFVRH